MPGFNLAGFEVYIIRNLISLSEELWLPRIIFILSHINSLCHWRPESDVTLPEKLWFFFSSPLRFFWSRDWFSLQGMFISRRYNNLNTANMWEMVNWVLLPLKTAVELSFPELNELCVRLLVLFCCVCVQQGWPGVSPCFIVKAEPSGAQVQAVCTCSTIVPIMKSTPVSEGGFNNVF